MAAVEASQASLEVASDLCASQTSHIHDWVTHNSPEVENQEIASVGSERWRDWEVPLKLEELRIRRVSPFATPTATSKYLKRMFVATPFHLEATGLKPIVLELLNSNQDGSTFVGGLLNKINTWLFGQDISCVTNRDFDRDKAFCKKSKALIERTIMISIFKRWQLHDLFVFNCDGQWKLDIEYRLPTTGRRTEIKLPQPSLAMFFKLVALTGNDGWASFPLGMSQYLYPDGGDERCFPFFVLEVYGDTKSRDDALLENMHTASQSLRNIYMWMNLAGKKKLFFEKVQVFSIVLDAEDISLRIHWALLDKAEPEEEDCLSFWFDNIISIPKYNGDQACQLVNKVMKYAEKELYSVLQETFQHVSQQEKRRRNRSCSGSGMDMVSDEETWI